MMMLRHACIEHFLYMIVMEETVYTIITLSTALKLHW